MTRDEMVSMYTLMANIKEMEQKAGDLYLEKTIRGFLHRCNGQASIYIYIHCTLWNEWMGLS